MDPVSLSLGLAGLVPLIVQAISSAKEYVSAVAGAKKSIGSLITELETLQSNIVNLQELLKDDGLVRSNVRFGGNSVLLSCCAACKTKLESLCTKLGRNSTGTMNRLLWPFSEKEHNKAVQDLRNFINWTQFALSVEGCRLLSSTADEVLRVMAMQINQFKAIQSLETNTFQIHAAIRDQTRILEDSVQRETKKCALDWISTLNHCQKHHALQLSREKNTGIWLLRREQYLNWRDAHSSETLWCYGIQGSGKTNLV